MVKRFFQIPAEAAKDIPAGHGGIVFLNGKKAGVYRDESGALHPVDIRCPPTWAASWSGTRTRRPGTAPLPRLSVRLPGPAYLRARTDRPGLQSPDRPAVFTAISRAVSIMIDLVRKGLSLRFTNQAAALVCGSSADVRPMSLLFTAWGQRRAPSSPAAAGRRGRWSGWSEKNFCESGFSPCIARQVVVYYTG